MLALLFFGDSSGATELTAPPESLTGGAKAKKRKPWPAFDDDYDEPRKVKPVVVSNIVKPKVEDFTAQIKAAVAQRKSLVSEIARLRRVEQLTAVGIAKIAELRYSRSLIDAEIERLRKLKRARQEFEEDEEMMVAFIVSELFH